MSDQAFHGSDIESIEKVFGIDKKKIISFSANVNPIGMSPRFLEHIKTHPDSLTNYPDREYTDLRIAISEYTNTDMENIRVGSGATELITNVINAVNPKKVLMIEPTYSEYARKLSEKKTAVTSYMLKQEDDFQTDMEDLLRKVSEGFDLIMICNPNNPTGTAYTKSQIADICSASKGTVLIDETYVEFTGDVDAYSAAGIVKDHPNLVILRGTSKFFATPGLRLGYLLCCGEGLKSKIGKISDPWSVNSVAAVSGKEMFKDEKYISETKSYVAIEMEKISTALKRMRLHVYEPSANFCLARIEKPGITGADVFSHCIKEAMMIRDCSSFASLGNNHIRICANTSENNDRLLCTMAELLG